MFSILGQFQGLTTPLATLASGESPFGIALSLPFWPRGLSIADLELDRVMQAF